MKDRLTTLKNYDSMVEAMFDQELLKSHQIESAINNEDTVELLPMFNDLNNGLKIMVFEKDYEKALQILNDYQKDNDQPN